MKIVYKDGLCLDEDLSLISNYAEKNSIHTGCVDKLVNNIDDDILSIRGGGVAFCKSILADYLHVVNKRNEEYIYSDLTYAGHPEMTLEYFPKKLVRKIKFLKNAFLPNGNLDMDIAESYYVHSFNDELLVSFVRNNIGSFGTPISLAVEPASVCNLRCSMCTWQVTNAARYWRGDRIMGFELLKKIAYEISRWQTKPGVEFCWRGEPLLNKYLFEAIPLFAKAGCSTSVYTNAQLLDDVVLKRVCESGLSTLNISIDGLDKELYERIHKGGQYEVAIKNIDRAVEVVKKNKYPMAIGLKMVRMEENRQYWDELFDRYKDKVEYVMLQNQVVYENGQYRCKNMYGYKERKFCILPFTTMLIAANGDVYNCGATNGEDENETLGNVEYFTLEEIWNGKKANDLRRQMLGLDVKEPFQCARCSRQVCAAGFVHQRRRGSLHEHTLEGARWTNRIETRSKSGNVLKSLKMKIKRIIQ